MPPLLPQSLRSKSEKPIGMQQAGNCTRFSIKHGSCREKSNPLILEESRINPGIQSNPLILEETMLPLTPFSKFLIFHELCFSRSPLGSLSVAQFLSSTLSPPPQPALKGIKLFRNNAAQQPWPFLGPSHLKSISCSSAQPVFLGSVLTSGGHLHRRQTVAGCADCRRRCFLN